MKRLAIFAVIVCAAWSSSSTAGVYTDDLSKCLVAGTSQGDRLTLVKWVFVAMSQHPAVSNLIKVSEADVAAANKGTGEMFTKLLTDTCAESTKSAVKYEGGSAIESAFSVLGQIAMRDLVSDPSVEGVMTQLTTYFDTKKFEALLKE